MDERDIMPAIEAAVWARSVHECCVPGCTGLKVNGSIYCRQHCDAVRRWSCPDCAGNPCECPHEWADDEVTP